MKKILSLLFVALLSIVASAYDAKIDGIYYNFSGDEATVTYRKYQNSSPYYISDYTGAVVIPASVTYNGKTYSVTSIGDYAFSGCSGLTSVTIPNSVISIGNYAFEECSSLTSVIIPNSVTSIGIGAFDNCRSLTSVTIPNSVTSIGHDAFRDCHSLTSVTIPNSVTSIGIGAFDNCSGLTSITIPNSVISIGNYAFSGCSGLTSIKVASGNSKYDSRNNCNAIIETATNELIAGCKNTIIPGSVTSIGCEAFYGCSGLTSVTIPNSVTSIGDYAFGDCSGLTSITIPNSVTSIRNYAFYGCYGLQKVIVPDIAAWCNISFGRDDANPLYYGNHLYSDETTEITDLVIPNSVTSIGELAFRDCSGLTSITIPNSVTSIGNYAFDGCSGLTSVTIGNSVTSIGDFAFSWCSSLTSIKVESGNSKYDSRNNCNAIIETTTNTLITGCKNTVIPNNVTSIGSEAFYGCSGLTSVTIPNSVTSIGGGAFYGCSGLTSVTIPNSVTSIGNSAFSYCSGLTSIIIPNSVTSIGNYAFSGCSGLKDVYCYAENVPSTDSHAFDSSPIASATLHLPAVSLEAYSTTEPWSNFGTFQPYYTLTYIVDGKVYKTCEVEYGAVITSEEEPTKEGYTFSGWSYIPGTMPATDVVVMGTFSINSYALTYMVDGEEYKTSTVVYGSEITPEAEPTKEGYTFSGWSEIPENMPAGDVVVTGSFIPNSYTLSYIVDGEEYKTASVTYGTAITPEAEPTKEGYTFSGWSEIPNTMPAEDVTVTGSFTINQYLLTYILEGEEYKSYEIDFNTALTPEPVPTKKGMTFSGWGDVPETMPAHNVTLTGSYTWSKEIVDGVVYQVADTLSNYASVVGYEGTGEEVTILSDVLIGEDVYAVNNIAENALPKTTTIYVSVGRLLLWLWTNGYEDIRDTDSGRCLPAPEISLEGKTASSLSLSYKNDYPQFSETITLQGSPVEKGKNGYDLALTGLEPDKLYEGLATLTLTYEEASYSKSFSFKTEPLTLTTQQPKIISLGNVIVAATSNLDDAEMNVGFEWRRTDWTDDFASNFGKAYLYKGTMEGYIRNLYIEKLWKYRPYYESNDGNRYYGNWVGIDPTNTSYFMPTVHTYSRINLTGNLAKIWGYVMRGTDNITMQGFIYWSISSTSSSRRNANGIPSDATKVLATGNVMSATLEDLDYDTEYCYMAFVTTSEGETFYGEPQTFKTSFDPDGIENVMASEEVTEVARYDIQGRMISKPQKGINIIRFSDGTTRKVIVKQ